MFEKRHGNEHESNLEEGAAWLGIESGHGQGGSPHRKKNDRVGVPTETKGGGVEAPPSNHLLGAWGGRLARSLLAFRWKMKPELKRIS